MIVTFVSELTKLETTQLTSFLLMEEIFRTISRFLLSKHALLSAKEARMIRHVLIVELLVIQSRQAIRATRDTWL